MKNGLTTPILMLILVANSALALKTTTQIIKDGGMAVTHTGSGSINITGYTIEQHQKLLLKELSRQKQDLEVLYSTKSENLQLKAQLAEKQIAEKESQIANLKDSYNQQIAFLQNTILQLRSLEGTGFNSTQITEAEQALQKGDTDKAYKLFAQIESQEQAAIERAAKAAFERGKIAENKIDYAAAFSHYQRALGRSPDNPEYLEHAGMMAITLAQLGKALEWTEKALQIILAQQNESSPDVARLRKNLGEAWHAKGNYDKAIHYYELALASDLKAYGEADPAVAEERNNLGAAWRAKGDNHKAIRYYELALVSDLKTYGDAHPTVAGERNNLGAAWAAKGDNDKAIGYYELALASDLKAYGDAHPAVARDRSNLGAAWAAKGDNDKAIGYFELALASDLKTYGDAHPKVAIRRNNLGAAWRAKGDNDKAIGYFELALASDLKTYGDAHPAVARDHSNLGTAWAAEGDYDKAIRYYEDALTIWTQTLGTHHPNTKTTLNNHNSIKEKHAARIAGNGEESQK